MGKWDDYALKSSPEDSDTVMIKDTSGAANKRVTLSALCTYIKNKIGTTSGSTMKKLTFTGAVSAEYDGSTDVSVDIPSGGSSGGSGLDHVTDTSDGVKISPAVNAGASVWSEERFSFGMSPSSVPVPLQVLAQLISDGTVICKGVASKMRWGLHVFEGYASDAKSRLTMLVNKHDSEDGRKVAEIYYYSTAYNESADAYGWVRIGSDVGGTGMMFSRDEMLGNAELTMRNIISLGNVDVANLPTSCSYATIDDAESAGLFSHEDITARRKYMQLYALRDAQNGAMFYDSANNRLVGRINGKWVALTGTEVSYSFGASETVAVTGISIPSTASCPANGTVTLSVTYTPSNTTQKGVTWESSDTSVATVSNGVVTWKKAGTVTIKAKSTANSSLSASCTVTCQEAASSGGDTGKTFSYSASDLEATAICWSASSSKYTVPSGETQTVGKNYPFSDGGFSPIKDISCASGDTLTVTVNSTISTLSVMMICFYDASGNVLTDSILSNRGASATVTAPTNAYAFRFTVYDSNQSGNITDFDTLTASLNSLTVVSSNASAAQITRVN